VLFPRQPAADVRHAGARVREFQVLSLGASRGGPIVGLESERDLPPRLDVLRDHEFVTHSLTHSLARIDPPRPAGAAG
jgi:hypothetical protein